MIGGAEPLVLTTALPTPVCLYMVPRCGPKVGAPVSGGDYLWAQTEDMTEDHRRRRAVVLKERPADAATRVAELLLEK